MATGIVRRSDDLGRIVIPKDIRDNLHIECGEPMEMFLEDNRIILQKYQRNPADLSVECAKYIRKRRSNIAGVNSISDETTVFFTDGQRVTVKRHSDDLFDLNVAICHAMKEAGFCAGNPVL